MVDKFDNELLISLVKTRPMLWDKSLETHKDLNQRSAAWREICRVLCPEYETLPRKDRHLYAKSVIKKWTNIRDAWRKSIIDTKMKKKTKPYLYHDYLRFLEKNLYHVKESFLDEEDCKTSGVENEKEKFEKLEKSERIDKIFVDSDDTSDAQYVGTGSHDGDSRGRKRRIADTHETESNIQFVDVKSTSGQKKAEEESPHVCFIRGLLPALNKLNDDEVLEFQGGVIQLLQSIRKKGNPLFSETVPSYGLPSSSMDLSHIKEDTEEI